MAPVVIPETLALGAIRATAALPVKMVRMGIGDHVDFVVGPAQLVFLDVLESLERMGNQACRAGLECLDVCPPAKLHVFRLSTNPQLVLSAPGAPGMKGSPGRRGPRGAPGKPGSFLPLQSRLGNIEFSLPESVSFCCLLP